jgi:hypothetical protein
MNTCVLGDAAKDDARHREGMTGSAVALMGDARPLVVSVAEVLGRSGKNFLGARLAPKVFASNVLGGANQSIGCSCISCVSAVSKLLDAPVSNNSPARGRGRPGKTL